MDDKFTISISKKAVFDKIRLFTSYLGGKNAQEAIEYDRVAAITQDIPLLSVIIENMATHLASSLGNAVISLEFDGDIVRFVMKNPLHTALMSATTDWQISVLNKEAPDISGIYNLIEGYITSSVIAEWLDIVGFKKNDTSCVSIHSASSAIGAEKLSALKQILNPPTIPTRPNSAKASPRRLFPF